MVVSNISSNIHAFHPILTQYSFFSGRYADFARQLTLCNFGVYAMDWIGNLIFIMYTFEILILHIIIFCDRSEVISFIATGHGGSDGLHGYVPSLDQVVADTVSISVLFIFILRMKRTLGVSEVSIISKYHLMFSLCTLHTDRDNIIRELSWKRLDQRILEYHAFSLVTPLEGLWF